MFPNLHPAAMVTPMGMGLAAFNPNAVPMQPHLRVPGPGSFLSGGGGGYYQAAFNGVQVPGGSPGGAKTNSTRNFTEFLFAKIELKNPKTSLALSRECEEFRGIKGRVIPHFPLQ